MNFTPGIWFSIFSAHFISHFSAQCVDKRPISAIATNMTNNAIPGNLSGSGKNLPTTHSVNTKTWLTTNAVMAMGISIITPFKKYFETLLMLAPFLNSTLYHLSIFLVIVTKHTQCAFFVAPVFFYFDPEIDKKPGTKNIFHFHSRLLTYFFKHGSTCTYDDAFL